MDGNTSIYQDLFFDKDTLTYTNHNYNDIFYDTGNPIDDFFILYESFYQAPLKERDQIAYTTFFNHLINYNTLSKKSYDTLLQYSSTELNDELKTYDISISLNDIVIFNQVKDMIEQIEKTNFPASISKNKLHRKKT